MPSLDLYLIRHGLAGEHGSYARDDDRPLTDDGQHKTRQVAQRLYDLELRFDLILTSPLVRAQQTADILLAAKLAQTVQLTSDLAPDGSLHEWLAWLKAWRSPNANALALVGHEPNLSAWAETLLWGQTKGTLILKKAGVLGLSLPENNPIGNSDLFWLAPPRFLL